MNAIVKSCVDSVRYNEDMLSCPAHPGSFSIGKNLADMNEFVTVSYKSGNHCCDNIKCEPVNRVTKVLAAMDKYGLTAEQMEKIQDEIVEMYERRRCCGLCI